MANCFLKISKIPLLDSLAPLNFFVVRLQKFTKRKNIDFEYDNKGWWKADDVYVVEIYLDYFVHFIYTT
jgi:hypothetical protein